MLIRCSIFVHSVIAASSIFTSAVATSVGAFATIILFLFCIPDIETLFSIDAPQPFVLIYSMALGRGGAVFMTIIAVIPVIFVSNFRRKRRLADSFDTVYGDFDHGRITHHICNRP